MADKIPKYLEDRNEWTTEQHFHFMKTGEQPISEEWEKRRREALEDADIELDGDGCPKPAEEQSVEEIAKGMESTKHKVGD